MEGNGEIVIQRLLDSLQEKDHTTVEKIPGLFYLKNGKFQGNPPESITPIDQIPFVSYDEIDITEIPPSKLVLKKAIKARGIKKLFNTSGEQYKKLRIKDKIGDMTEVQAIELLSSNGRLVKRPIVVDGNRITVGFDEIEYKEVWS